MSNPSAVVRAALVSAVLALGGCATLSETECRNANWSDIGFRDGRNGRVADRISDHAKACSKYDISPDRQAYFDGRDEGLVQYCTTHSGFVAGTHNEPYAGVCAPLDERPFLFGFTRGKELFQARSALSKVESEIAQVDDKRRKSDLSEPDRDALVEERIELEPVRTEARSAVERLEWLTREL